MTDKDILFAPDEPSRPHVIVLGNEKGGTGKSTTAMHLAVALARMGYDVGSIDCDGRQGTLSRYVANREATRRETARPLAGPRHHRIGGDDDGAPGPENPGDAARQSEDAALRAAFADLHSCDFIVVDTPGADTPLSRFAHVNADTLITPLNDSFLDIDVLARIDFARREVLGPSMYTRLVWEQNNRRVAAGLAPIDWIVARNRLTHIESRNMRDIAALMERLGRRIGFRIARGFGERVVFRELFLQGLTLFDLDEEYDGARTSPSHFAARSEIADLLSTIGVAPYRGDLAMVAATAG